MQQLGGGGGTISPTDISDLVAWYDASNTGDITANGLDQVTDWAGRDGYGPTVSRGATNAVRSAQETQNSLNVVSFDGTAGGLNSNSPFMFAAGALTVFVVARFSSTAGLRPLVGETNGTSDASSQYNPLRLQTISSTAQLIGSGARFGGSQWLLSLSGTNPGIGNYFTATAIDTGSNFTIRTDGVQRVSGAYTRDATTPISQFRIGGLQFSGGVGYAHSGTIAEIVVYDRVLTSDEVDDVEAYLAAKWGL